MKNTLSLLTALGASLFAGPALAHAAFNPAIVPADAQWLVHADLKAVRDSALGRELVTMLSQIGLTKEADPIRLNFQKIFETAGSLTAFGRDLSGNPEAIDGALILQGTADLRTIADGLAAQFSLTNPEALQELKDLPFTAYTVAGTLVVALPPEPIVIVSKSREHLLKALEVFRGKAPSMASARSRLTPLTPSGNSFFVMAASVVPSTTGLFAQNAPQARILQMATAASAALGESGTMTTARVQLEASSDEIADKLGKIVNGLIAVLSLTETNDQRLTEFVKAATVTREGRSVRLDLSYSTERILQMTRELASERQARSIVSRPPQRLPEQAPLNMPGRLLGAWTAKAALGGIGPSATNFVTHTIDRVALQPGNIIVLGGRRHSGENARFDYIELTPVAGGTPQRFEAEYMRLTNYRTEAMALASGGEDIIITADTGDARLRYPGLAGEYRLDVRYVDESDGESMFGVSILETGVESNGPAVLERN